MIEQKEVVMKEILEKYLGTQKVLRIVVNSGKYFFGNVKQFLGDRAILLQNDIEPSKMAIIDLKDIQTISENGRSDRNDRDKYN